MDPVRSQTRVEDLPLFAAARPRPVSVSGPTNPKGRPLSEASDDGQRVWRVLERDCRGIDNACTAAVIGLRAGIESRDGRKIRDIIKANLENFPLPVLGSSGNPAGYYVPATPEEMSRGHAEIRSRLIDLAARERALVRQGKAQGWTHQGDGRWA